MIIGGVELQVMYLFHHTKKTIYTNNYNIVSVIAMCCGICRASTLPIFEIQMKMNIFNPTTTLYIMWNYPLTIH